MNLDNATLAIIGLGYVGLPLAVEFGKHGHIKFWSFLTLGTLLREAGFTDIRFLRVGRIPPLAKSMIAVARRPSASNK